MKRYNPKSPIRLANVNCPYCGRDLTDKTRTKEHVISKRFVPKGTFDGSWNLILNACRACNNAKSDLEDDISAITMQPDPFGRFADPKLQSEAERKRRNSMMVHYHEIPLTIENVQLLCDLEMVHEEHDVKDWEKELDKIAIKYDLCDYMISPRDTAKIAEKNATLEELTSDVPS